MLSPFHLRIIRIIITLLTRFDLFSELETIITDLYLRNGQDYKV